MMVAEERDEAVVVNHLSRRCWFDNAAKGNCNGQHTRWFEGVGWRCRWHQPDPGAILPSIQATWREPLHDTDQGEQPVSPNQRPAVLPSPPPCELPRTLRDCERLYAWAAGELMRGAMDANHAKAIKHMLDGFRMSWKDNAGKKLAEKITKGLREGR